MKYTDHTGDLRYRTNLEIQLMSGFITLNVLIAAWLFRYQDKLKSCNLKILFSLFIIAIGGSIIAIMIRNTKRRKIVIQILENINESFKFYEEGVYHSGVINPAGNKHQSVWQFAYYFLIIVFIIIQIHIVWFV